MAIPESETLEALAREPLREFTLTDLFRIMEARFGERSSQANVGALRVALRRLEDAGCVDSRRDPAPNDPHGALRTVFRLKPGGRARALAVREERSPAGSAEGAVQPA